MRISIDAMGGDYGPEVVVPAAAQKCRDIIEAMTAEVKVGKIYSGRVVSIKDFGCFVELLPGLEGLVHVSELANDYVYALEEADLGATAGNPAR